MDKKSILGFVLIGIILLVWLFWSSENQRKIMEQREAEQKQKQELTDTLAIDTDSNRQVIKDTISFTEESERDSIEILSDSRIKLGEIFYPHSIEYAQKHNREEKFITVSNSLAVMQFTNYGGTLREYTMTKFKTWDKLPLQLVDWRTGKELDLLFTSKDGVTINTRDLVFEADYENWKNVNLDVDSNFTLVYSVNLDSAGTQKILKTYTFQKDSYEFNVKYELLNSGEWLSGSKYQIVWGSSLNLTEFRSDEEANFSEAFAYMGGELQTLDASEFDEEYIGDYNGNTEYVSSRNKYFGIFLIPNSRKADGSYLSGKKVNLPNEGFREEYSIGLKLDVKDDKRETFDLKVLLVPLDYQILKEYGKDLELTLRFPLDFIVRPIAQWLILPFFNFLHMFIPNFGLVIIVFAICLKLLLNPLMKKQMESMKKMGTLSPKMNEIREKYKDDPVKANQQIMKLYKEQDINPAGGCIPMLLQLPILYALFGVFRSTIELRQQPFVLWITDLSAPDIIATLPFKIPIFGIDSISGVALLMGVTMFFQQKMTMTDPKQKALIYVLPVMLTLLFFNFPSGLNLYYFMFNLLSIAQQWYTNKYKPAPPVDTTSKKPRKKSWMEKLQDRAEELQKERSKMHRKRR